MTSSRGVVLQGRQQPRVEHRPPWVSEDAADEAIDLAASVGLILDPWQQAVVRAALAERADGSWAANEVGFLVARQNGKGGALEAIVLHGMFLVGDPLTLWTAHQTKTAFEAFLRIRGWVDGSDDLRRLVAKVSLANGDEGIELRSGVRLRFVARSKSSGRGFSPQRIIFDEAQELSSLAVDAMLPAMSAQPNWQAVYTGTVPGPENNAEHFTRVRDRGRAGKSDRLAWLEWSPKGSDDPAVEVDVDDRRNWAAANPALGYRIRESGIAAERESMSPGSFGKERLSIWPTVTGVVDDFLSGWGNAGTLNAPSGQLSLGLDVSHDLRSAALVVFGGGVLEVVDYRRNAGTGWVPDRVVELRERHRIDAFGIIGGRSPAASLLPKLPDDTKALTGAEEASACAAFAQDINEGRLWHRSQASLDIAVGAAVRVTSGDGSRWSLSKSPLDISPLRAASVAAYLGSVAPPPGDPGVYLI